ncbi:MAG: 30S ribosomal protein S20 [Planctomycetota bacterium]
MAHSLSAKKRIRQNVKRRALNRWRKRGYRESIKEYDELILHGSVEQCEDKLNSLYKQLDQTAATPAMHKNTASRYKARLAARLNRKRTASA